MLFHLRLVTLHHPWLEDSHLPWSLSCSNCGQNYACACSSNPIHKKWWYIMLLCVILDCKIPYQATFGSPFGSFHFICLSWKLTYAQDIVQHMMDPILDRGDGTIGIAIDIIIHDKNDTEHDWYLCILIHIFHDYSLVLNHDKNVVKATSVSVWQILRCAYDAQGIHAKSDKFSSLHASTHCSLLHNLRSLGVNHILIALYSITHVFCIYPYRVVEERHWLPWGQHTSLWQHQITIL